MPKRWVRVVAGMMLLSTIVLGGFGCKGVSADYTAKTQPMTLEYWTVFDDVDALQQLATIFEQNHPYVNIRIRQFRPDEIYQQYVDALAEDRGPDIISVQNRALGQYQSKLGPMPSAVEDVTMQVVQGQFSNQTVYNSQIVQLPTAVQIDRDYVQAVKGDVVRNGQVYGLPLSFDTLALYYNKDLLDRAGIAQPPQNWDDFVADVKKLTIYDKSNQNKIIQAGAAMGTGANVPASDDLLYVLFRQSNVAFADRVGHAVFNQNADANSAQATLLDFYTDFANSSKDRYTWNASMENALDSFVQGHLAFFFGYYYNLPIITQQAPQLNFDIIPIPQLNAAQPVNAANYWVQTVPAKSKHSAMAWDFINFITHTSANKVYLDSTKRPAALRTYLAAQISAAGVTTSTPVQLSPFASQALVAESWYKGNNYDAAKAAINTMLEEWLTPPADSSKVNQWRKDVMDRAASRINQTF